MYLSVDAHVQVEIVLFVWQEHSLCTRVLCSTEVCPESTNVDLLKIDHVLGDQSDDETNPKVCSALHNP